MAAKRGALAHIGMCRVTRRTLALFIDTHYKILNMYYGAFLGVRARHPEITVRRRVRTRRCPDMFYGVAYAWFCARERAADDVLDDRCFEQSSECSVTSVSPPEITGC